MDSKTKRKEVTALIDSIKEHSDRLKDTSTIPMLEMSVILSKINRLHESTLILKYLLAREQNYEEEEFGVRDYFNKPYIKKEEKVEEVSQREDESPEEDATELEDGEEIIVEMEHEQELEEGEEEMPEEELFEESPAIEVEEKPIEEIIERLEQDELIAKPDLNEQYAEGEDKSVGDQLQKQPIADLVSAIGLNERYLYANELFNGDTEAFKAELSRLNESSNFDDAKRYFEEEMVGKNKWEKDHEMVHALRVLIERRFL